MSNKYKYFSAAELACRCGKCGLGQNDMNEDFMEFLISLREKLGFQFPVTSAIRCPEHNNNVSSTGLDGPHTTGHAVDIQIYGSHALWLVEYSVRLGMSGVGVFQKGPLSQRFIHLDDLNDITNPPRPWIWSY